MKVIKSEKNRLRKITRRDCIGSKFEVLLCDKEKGGLIEIKHKNVTTKCLILRVLGIDIFHYSEQDQYSTFKNFASATSAVHIPCRYVFSDAVPNLSQQINFLNYKLDKCEHRFARALLNQQINAMRDMETNHRDRLTYLLLFSKDENELYEAADDYSSYMVDTSVELCTLAQTKEFVRNYMGAIGDYDTLLPQNIEFKQNCSIIDGMYQTVITVYDYPAILKNLEIAALIAGTSNVTFTLDVEGKSKTNVLNELKFSLKELKAREVLNMDVTEADDTEVEFDKLREIRDSIANGAEQMMYVTLKIIVSGSTYKELEKTVKIIMQELEGDGISAYVPINEQEQEYFSRLSCTNEIKNPFPLQDTFRTQYPFYYQQHLDSNSLLFGRSGTGGIVGINFFERTPSRPSYDLLLCGIKGSGKSVMLKSLVQDHLMLGHKLMVLDIESEYQAIAAMFGGQVIKLTKNSRLNTLEMHRVVDYSVEKDTDDTEGSENTPEDEFSINFASEISRIITFFYQYLPEMSNLQAEELKDIIVDTYRQFGITDSTDVTKLSPEDFPIFSDLLATVRKRLYINGQDGAHNNLTERKIDNLESIETSIKQLSEGMYSAMFNGYSTISVEDCNLIVFDVKSLSEMDERIYNAQLFNILSLMWAETCKNASYNSVHGTTNDRDRRYVISVIDEAHRFINANNSHVTDFIEKECRRTRKYDAALWLASQSISDFNPQGASEGAVKVRTIFTLIQYKIILKQSGEGYDTLCETFKQFPSSELLATKDYEPGEMLISFGSDRHKIHCRREVSDAHLLYIGNIRDADAITHRFFNTYYTEKTHAEYGNMLLDKDTYDNFIKVFSAEIEGYFGYSEEDSDYLHKQIVGAVKQLADELISDAQRSVRYQ